MSLELATPLYQVKHSNTEALLMASNDIPDCEYINSIMGVTVRAKG